MRTVKIASLRTKNGKTNPSDFAYTAEIFLPEKHADFASTQAKIDGFPCKVYGQDGRVYFSTGNQKRGIEMGWLLEKPRDDRFDIYPLVRGDEKCYYRMPDDTEYRMEGKYLTPDGETLKPDAL